MFGGEGKEKRKIVISVRLVPEFFSVASWIRNNEKTDLKDFFLDVLQRLCLDTSGCDTSETE